MFIQSQAKTGRNRGLRVGARRGPPFYTDLALHVLFNGLKLLFNAGEVFAGLAPLPEAMQRNRID
jgi:hypothetical protein